METSINCFTPNTTQKSHILLLFGQDGDVIGRKGNVPGCASKSRELEQNVLAHSGLERARS